MFDVAARALGFLPAETAHRVTIRLAKAFSPLLPPPPADDPRLGVDVLGLRFPNPVGLAAGFDKDAEVPDAMLRFGFGFVECGTLTPQTAAGQCETEAVSSARGSRGDKPDGVQQSRHRRCSKASRAARPDRHRRNQYRREQGFGRPHRRLRVRLRTPRALCRLHRGQCLFAEHARAARPAESRGAAALARYVDPCAARQIETSPAQDRAGPRRTGDGRHRASRSGFRHRGLDRFQHYAGAAGIPQERQRGRSRRPFGQASAGAFDASAETDAQACRATASCLSVWAAFRAVPTRMRRSAQGRASCNSTRRWPTKALALSDASSANFWNVSRAMDLRA